MAPAADLDQREERMVDVGGFTEIVYAVEGGVATITLNRPDKMNAFTHVMCQEIVAACDQIDADDDVRVVVVTGSGRAFCAGADLDPDRGEFESVDSDESEHIGGVPRDIGGIAALRFAALLKPTIAAINGVAVGVGITMTLPMNIRIAARGARIGFVFTRRALVPEAASSWFLPRTVGISRAMEWITTGRLFDAEEAQASGLVSHVHAKDDLLPSAYTLAHDIAENTSPIAQAAAKRMLWGMLGADSPRAAHELDSRLIFDLVKSADFAEGVAAFLEKRRPHFRLRPSVDVPAAVPQWP